MICENWVVRTIPKKLMIQNSLRIINSKIAKVGFFFLIFWKLRWFSELAPKIKNRQFLSKNAIHPTLEYISRILAKNQPSTLIPGQGKTSKNIF
jgi:CBS domain containing-hemolysin-like protein